MVFLDVILELRREMRSSICLQIGILIEITTALSLEPNACTREAEARCGSYIESDLLKVLSIDVADEACVRILIADEIILCSKLGEGIDDDAAYNSREDEDD